MVALLDKEGNLVESYRYTAFGEMEADSAHTVDNPWMYSSKRFDPETGFIYFGRRYYAPDIGRWITPDPAGYADGPNLYAYVHNHPLAYIDPDGQLAFLLAPLAISLAIDFFLPTAITCIQPYVGVMACSFIAGLAQGYNLDFTPAALDPSTLACQQAGITLGVMLNLNPTKLAGNALKSVSKVGTDILKKEAIEATANVVASKFKNVFTWCKPQQAFAQATQKTVQVAESGIAKTRMLPDLDALSRAGQVMDRAGLTKAGRALDKHGGRINSVFPKATGNPMNKNIQGQFHFDDILTNPKSTFIKTNSGTIKCYAPDGRGIQLKHDGTFKGFIERNYEKY